MVRYLAFMVFCVFICFVEVPPGHCESAAGNSTQRVRGEIDLMRIDNPDKYKDFHYALRHIRAVNRRQKELTSLYVAKALVDHVHWEKYRFASPEHRLNFLSVLIGIVRVESGFNPDAVSSKNARGLMQVHWPTWKRYFTSPEDVHNLNRNLHVGTGILRLYMQQSNNDLRRALYKYLGARDDRYADKVIAGAVAFKRSVLQNPIKDPDKNEIKNERHPGDPDSNE
ncbi:MAG: lytic transglycosylase domain-containing protein [Syntrophorhabdaceae bacterium]